MLFIFFLCVPNDPWTETGPRTTGWGPLLLIMFEQGENCTLQKNGNPRRSEEVSLAMDGWMRNVDHA